MTEKFWTVGQPPLVALVGESERASALEAALGAGDYAVERVERTDAAERVAAKPSVECLWFAGATRGDLALVEQIATRAPATSVVFAPESGSEELAAAATAAGASEYVAAGSDVETCIERAETALSRGLERRADATKRAVLDSMCEELDASLYAKDEEARHVLFGGAGKARRAERLYGKTDREAYGDDGGTESYRDDRRVIENGERMPGSAQATGDQWFWTTKGPWREGGEIRGLVGATFDVTETRTQEQELLQQVARLQQIPDFVNHDLKNDLAVAQGYLELAAEGHEGALETVEEALDHIEVLFDDFHTLATEGFNDDSAQQPIAFAPTVEEVWGYVNPGDATLEVDVPPGTTLAANRAALRPVLKNLLGNAVEHSSTGSQNPTDSDDAVEHSSTSSRTQSGDAVEHSSTNSRAESDDAVTVRVGILDDGFYVEDDGPGIDDGEQEAVFEHGYTTAAAGTGLGLAIVREVVRTQGWTVELAEGDLGGARFEIRSCRLGRPFDAEPTGPTLELSESADVGDVRVAGETTRTGDAYTLRGAGENIWGDVNEFHFAHVPVEGDVSVRARIADVGQAGEWGKAGAMVRSGLDTDAAYGMSALVARNRIPELDWRSERGAMGENYQLTGATGEYDWLRVDRVGDELCCALSSDGEEWAFVDRRPVGLGETVLVGLAVCSTVPEERIEATFEDVSVRRLD